MTTPYCILQRWRGYNESSLFLFISTFHVTPSNKNLFRFTGPFWGEINHQSLADTHKGQWRGALMFSLIYAWTNGWANNRHASDLRGHCVHYDVTNAFPEMESNHYLDQRWHNSPRFLGHGWLVTSPRILCVTELGHYWLKLGLIDVMAS